MRFIRLAKKFMRCVGAVCTLALPMGRTPNH